MISVANRLLLVEDNASDARLVCETLRDVPDGEFAIEIVTDLASAVAMLAERHFDAVLLDLSLPDSQGTATVETINREAPHVPLVVLTGLEDSAVAYDALKKGAQDYLNKGQLDAPLLARAIRYAIQRKAIEDTAKRSVSLLQATLESTADGIIVLDNSRNIINYNQRFAEMLGMPRSVLTASDGERWMQFLLRQLADPERFRRRVEELFAEEDQSYDLLEFRDGRIYERLSIPYVLEEKIIGRVWSFRDVTERRRAIDELRRARQAAEAANRAKSDFLADLSHEIRTPLNTIIGMAELLADEPNAGAQRDAIETMRRASEALLGLVSDVLDLSKIEAGRLELHATPFVLREVIDGAVELMRPHAERKRLRFASRIDPDVVANVIGDPNRLRQVLLNLLTNAIKFTERGEVELQVSNDADLVRFTISDTGPGIPASKLAVAFDPFEQLDRSIGLQYGGSGLGLGIARRLVELMGGRIWADSEPGRGSRFQFTARLEPHRLALAAHGAEPAPQGTGAANGERTLRVLLAEDSEDNRTLIRLYLRNLPIELDATADGAAALERFRSGPYDLVLLDLQMPVLDGYQAVRAMRQLEREQDRSPTPILALTAHAVDEKLARCVDAGCSGFLTKPLTRLQLLAAIREHVSVDDRKLHDGVLAG